MSLKEWIQRFWMITDSCFTSITSRIGTEFLKVVLGPSKKNLIILRPIGTDENPSEVNLNWSDFHVHVHGLSLNKMTKDMTIFIGNQIGCFVDVEMDSSEVA
ncbi:hypothetical protein Salat_2612900 [Sesamum alatum]|uniref:Uncharacterized protein n=1 Tax=Sesamum alatum TaxID=300844 RepID=A0AAE1XNE2_9LAMI|nr:hypothetical protein Salat_2612900 [Sesamum alatum]